MRIKHLDSIKEFLKKDDFLRLTSSFDGANIIRDQLLIDVTFSNGRKMKMVGDDKFIGCQPFLKFVFKFSIKASNKGHDTWLIRRFVNFVDSTNKLKDGDYFLHLLQFYIDSAKHYSTHAIFHLDEIEKISFRKDVLDIIYKLDGLGKTKEYKLLLKDFTYIAF